MSSENTQQEAVQQERKVTFNIKKKRTPEDKLKNLERIEKNYYKNSSRRVVDAISLNSEEELDEMVSLLTICKVGCEKHPDLKPVISKNIYPVLKKELADQYKSHKIDHGECSFENFLVEFSQFPNNDVYTGNGGLSKLYTEQNLLRYFYLIYEQNKPVRKPRRQRKKSQQQEA